MRLLGRILLIAMAVVGGIVLSMVALAVYIAADNREPALPPRIALRLDLDKSLSESPPDNPLAQFTMDGHVQLQDIIDGLDRAAKDDRVGSVIATLSANHTGMAKAQEIRDAVLRFRASGKPAILFSESFGEFGAGTVEYYIASAFSQIWLQPSGNVSITGYLLENPFLRDSLDWLGVQPRFAGRYEYKSAIETFTEKAMSGNNRESLETLMSSWYGQTVDGIARARNLPADQVEALVNRAPFLAQEALDAKLVDRLGYWDEAEAEAVKGGAKAVDLRRYLAASRPDLAHAPKIAVIYGVGAVQRGKGDGSPIGGTQVMGSETLSKAFREAAKDPAVKAILFRVDSPGGSYVASDTIWHEVARARAAGKPVIVSMGDLAASGGYFVSMGADKIVAQPGTITGSIGVFSGKMVLTDLWKKLGINWDGVHRGDNAPMWSTNSDFSPEAWGRINVMLDRIYADFTTKAAQGRNLKAEDMDSRARGRIWSGADAKRLGLVDELGGMDVALKLGKQSAGIAPDSPVALVPYPKPKGPLEFLSEVMGDDEAPARIAGLSANADLARLARLARPLLDHLEAVDPAVGGELRMPPVTTGR